MVDGCGCCSKEITSKNCPICDTPGLKVKYVTVKSLVVEEKASCVKEVDYFLCPNPKCEIVYFSPDDKTYFLKADLKVRVWLKDDGLDVPLCYCQEVTRRDILNALALEYPGDVKAVMERMGAGRGGNCLYRNPTGRCCHPALEEFIARQKGS